ncbi:MAG: hypothetical protein SCARUB_01734 [Candidatus Scalindua rubra]|uniref:C4-type zinc ribbon domain-containing protein n=1 Tax=Candidatus Scalindua rubra TaxID=1872076 RepID=A0A1E3XBY4_9BACT|nr:MAG: hypothetical protein SCARUB_01734 [Candidatus Scalindua rubra]
MVERIEILKRLQSIKNKISELEEFKKCRKNDIQKKKELIDNKRILSEKRHEEKISIQKEIDSKELELKTDEEKVNKYNVQLNAIKTNKEYSALCSEIGCKKADMSLLEDEILSTMSKLEVVDKEGKELTEELKCDEESLKELIINVDADVKRTDSEIGKLQKDQEQYINLLDEESLRYYKRLSNIKGGKAVVAIIGNVCGGCYMNITTQTLNLLISGKELVFCPSCSRILYLDEK